MKKTSYVMIAVAALLLFFLIVAPAGSISSNQCSSCHGSTYSQQLDILEGNSQNSIPSTIQVGQTLTVTIVLENINNAPRYNQLSGVTATLEAKNNHFSVNPPTYNIGSLSTGTATATWQITGTSFGSDNLVITAIATNTHGSVTFADNYSPNPSITISGTASPTPTPVPTQSPTDTPAPTATPATARIPTSNPTSTPYATTTPKQLNNPTAFPTATPNQTATPSPTPTATEKTNQRHQFELDSIMLYIHPPLAVASYAFIFLFAAMVLRKANSGKTTTILGVTAWLLTLLGLLTGMLWARIAWGSYWSWDLKETLTLALFLTLSAGQTTYIEGKQKATKWLLILSCILAVATGLSSFIISGLHSFA